MSEFVTFCTDEFGRWARRMQVPLRSPLDHANCGRVSLTVDEFARIGAVSEGDLSDQERREHRAAAFPGVSPAQKRALVVLQEVLEAPELSVFAGWSGGPEGPERFSAGFFRGDDAVVVCDAADVVRVARVDPQDVAQVVAEEIGPAPCRSLFDPVTVAAAALEVIGQGAARGITDERIESAARTAGLPPRLLLRLRRMRETGAGKGLVSARCHRGGQIIASPVTSDWYEDADGSVLRSFRSGTVKLEPCTPRALARSIAAALDAAR